MATGDPSDPEDDFLRSLERCGWDMTKRMEFEFFVAFPDAVEANAFEEVAQARGYRTQVTKDDERSSWTCICYRSMFATYLLIVGSQRELDRLARHHGGHIDGWDFAGNV